MNWDPPEKPTIFAEKRLIEAILKNVYPVNSFLPSERELCLQLGVTRPTLRETLQRMRQDGWIEIHQGKPTRVRNYLQEGNLNVLNAIADANVEISTQMIENLLEVRVLIAPTYFRNACQKHADELIHYLRTIIPIAPHPKTAGQNDWELHKRAASLSGNPVFLLILNGFEKVYLRMAEIYFSQLEAREASNTFYNQILEYTCQQEEDLVSQYTKEMMQASIQIWKKSYQIWEKK